MGYDVRDNPSQVFTVTNFTEDLTLSCTEDTYLSGAQVLGSLINELQKKGVLTGTTST